MNDEIEKIAMESISQAISQIEEVNPDFAEIFKRYQEAPENEIATIPDGADALTEIAITARWAYDNDDADERPAVVWSIAERYFREHGETDKAENAKIQAFLWSQVNSLQDDLFTIRRNIRQDAR